MVMCNSDILFQNTNGKVMSYVADERRSRSPRNTGVGSVFPVRAGTPKKPPDFNGNGQVRYPLEHSDSGQIANCGR